MRAVQAAGAGVAAAVRISTGREAGAAEGGVGSGNGGDGRMSDVGGDAGERGIGGAILREEDGRGGGDDGSRGGCFRDFRKGITGGDT